MHSKADHCEVVNKDFAVANVMLSIIMAKENSFLKKSLCSEGSAAF